MSQFVPPQGYTFDENTGLYYTQIIAKDERGALSQVVTWFDSNKGEYFQEVYPIDNQGVQPEQDSDDLNYLDQDNLSVRAPHKKSSFSHFTSRLGLTPLSFCLFSGTFVVIVVLFVGVLGFGWFVGGSKADKDADTKADKEVSTEADMENASAEQKDYSSFSMLDEETKDIKTNEQQVNGNNSVNEGELSEDEALAYGEIPEELLNEAGGFNPDIVMSQGNPQSGCKYAGGYQCVSLDIIDDLEPRLILEEDGYCSLYTYQPENVNNCVEKYDGWYTYDIEVPEFVEWGENCYFHLHFPTPEGERTAEAMYDQESQSLIFYTPGFGQMYEGVYSEGFFEKIF